MKYEVTYEVKDFIQVYAPQTENMEEYIEGFLEKEEREIPGTIQNYTAVTLAALPILVMGCLTKVLKSCSVHKEGFPVEATAFLGAVAAFVVLLLVFFLYLNKKWCFYSIGGFPCCDEPLGAKASRSKELGKAYSYEEPESSSDSEEDVLRRLQQSGSLHSAQLQMGEPVAGPSGASPDFYHSQPPAIESPPARSPKSPQDLISLAEKGKVGSSSASSSCSTTSGEEEHHKEKVLRHRGPDNTSYHKLRCSVDTMEETPPRVVQLTVQPQPQLPPPQQQQILPPPPPQQQYMENVNNQDCIVVLPQEQLFDVTDLQSDQESHLVSKCGHLEVAFAYDAPIRKMTVRVLQARDIPARDRGGATHTQVRLLLLPGKKQKHKTKIRSGDTPQYMESFLLHKINPEDVNSMGVRFRLYGCERMRRERMIGECMVSFSSINLELETTMWLALEPRANLANSSVSDLRSIARSDSTGSTHSMQHGGVPELLLGLAYNGTTGRLSVEVVKGSHFSLLNYPRHCRNLAMTRAPDTYVKLCLVSSNGQEMARSKTSIRRGQPNPLFKETFMFQVALFQLPDVTMMVSVYSKRSMKRKEMIGWFSLGLNSSGEEELAHWNDMRDVRGEQICRWHVLVES
ncbi:synaptotagmin-14 [Anabrus simplex]|uniref:synaptotagmin-14 n=1 Tax=Anabrus simplex TaxID=316456 RepID=UPI0035A2D4ED